MLVFNYGTISITLVFFFLIEMITCAYIVTYVQVYLFNDFDEAKRFSLKEWVELLACIILYDLLAYLLGWFGRGNVAWVLIFFSVYLLICYFSIYIANKIKRKIDTNRLNQLLERTIKRRSEDMRWNIHQKQRFLK